MDLMVFHSTYSAVLLGEDIELAIFICLLAKGGVVNQSANRFHIFWFDEEKTFKASYGKASLI